MHTRYKKLGIFVVLLLLASFACDLLGTGDPEQFAGTWDMQNETDFLDEDSFGLEGAEEFMDFNITFTFSSENDITFGMTISMDIYGMLMKELAGEEVEIVAEPLVLTMSVDGTYELVSGDVIQFNFDNTTLAYSPEEYCFSVMGEETCWDMKESVEGVDIPVIGSGAGYYEIDENTLTLWDDDCDYPTEQTCAIKLTK